jgi:DNA sulfur modification protein DndE
MKKTIFFLLPVLLMAACGSNQNNTATSGNTTSGLPDSTIIQTAREAYTFGLPLVLMDITRRQMTNAGNPGPMSAAENSFRHLSMFPDASFRDVVRPNADTYYSSAWLDLLQEPVVLSVPNTNGRYYMMPMLDAYTNVFASPGKRTTGTAAGNFLITGPQWSGTIPAGMKQIKAPTNIVWIIGRTQVNSKEDGEKVVVPIQKQYKLTPLSAWGKPYTAPAPVADSSVPKGAPNDIVKAMPVDEFFNYMNKLMVDNPPAADDKPALDKFAVIGIKPGGKFSLDSFSDNVKTALKSMPEDLLAQLSTHIMAASTTENGWNPNRGTVGTYGTDYVARAAVAYGGLGANIKEDAMYPLAQTDADGNKLTGTNNYIIHFEKGQTPPANAFWSITLYDSEGFMVKNPINRNAIGDRSNLKQNADGSTNIYIQHASPGKDKESNWLPAPEGDFNLTMRVYWPKEEMINGTWKLPVITKVK